jgi:hypothetical protein
MREAAKEATELLYAPKADPYREAMVKNADCVFYFDERPRAETKLVASDNSQALRSQTY